MTRKMLIVYRGHINNYILHAQLCLGNRKLSQLPRRSIDEFRDRVRSAGVSVPTTRKVIATLHSVLELAISQDWVATNAARGVKVRGKRGEGPKKIEPPSKEDIRALVDELAMTYSLSCYSLPPPVRGPVSNGPLAGVT